MGIAYHKKTSTKYVQYTLRIEESILDKIKSIAGKEDLSLNPFTFTNYEGFDPEWADAQVGDGTGGVSSRTYQVGVNLKF